MRTILMAFFWFTNLSGVLQLYIIALAGWIIFSGTYAFSDLTVNILFTQYIPALLWIKTLLIAILDEFGHWILAMPVLIIAPLKFVGGTVMGLWAYSVAKKLPASPAYP